MTGLLVVTVVAVLASLVVDRQRTWRGLRVGARMFVGILPAMVLTVAAVGLVLGALSPGTLDSLLGGSGPVPFVIGLVVGAIALIPGFIAYPLAGLLRSHGVSTAVLAAFVTSLMMVGVLTLPLEARFLGWRAAGWRNALSFVAAVAVALAMAWVLP